MTGNYSKRNLSGVFQAGWDKIKGNSRRGKSKDFEIRIRLDQNVGAVRLDRLNSWSPKTDGTQKTRE